MAAPVNPDATMTAIVIPDIISFNEEQATSIPDLTVQASNLMANFDSKSYHPSLQILIECLRHSDLSTAFTTFNSMPHRLVSLAFSTALYKRNEDVVQFEVEGGRKLSVKKTGFIRLLGLPTEGFFVNPTSDELLEMFNAMGYSPPITRISHFKKNRLPFIWNLFFTFFKRCLCGRKSGLDSASQQFLTCLYGVYFDVQVDFGSILWFEFIESLKISTKDSEISSHRFWSVILESAYRDRKIPYDAAEEPQMNSISLSIPAKIPDQSEFSVIGPIPETMLHKVPSTNPILNEYRNASTTAVQSTLMVGVPHSKKRKEKVTTESPIKPTKQQKKNKGDIEESSQKKKLKSLVLGSKRKSSKVEVAKPSKTRKQIIFDESDDDDDVEIISELPLVETSVQHEIVVTDPITAEKVADPITETHVAEKPITEEMVGDEPVNTEHVATEAEVVKEPVIEKQVEKEIIASERIVGEKSLDEDAPTIDDVNEEEESDQDVRKTNEGPASEGDIGERGAEGNVADRVTQPGGAISTPEIFANLQNLSVSIPADTPLVQPAKTQQETSGFGPESPIVEQQEASQDDNEDFVMAPFTLVDQDDGLDENDFMTIKQYRILNRKMNGLINSLETPVENDIRLSTEVEKFVLEITEQMGDVKKDVSVIQNTLGVFGEIQTHAVDHLRKLEKDIEVVDLKVTTLDEKVSIYESHMVKDLHTQLKEAKEREEDLKKKLDEALLQTKQLGDKIHNYDTKDLSDAYNENVVKHVSVVQRDLIAKLQPVINLANRLPVGIAKPAVASQQGGEMVVSKSPQVMQMNMPLFPLAKPQTIQGQSFSQVITKPQPYSQVITQPITKTLVLGSQSTTYSTRVSSEAGPSSDKGKAVVSELSKDEENLVLRQRASLMRQGEMSVDLVDESLKKQTWTEDIIRTLAFGEPWLYDRLPRDSYEANPSEGFQVDLPMVPLLFAIKCFTIPASLNFSEKQYNDTLIRFYCKLGKKEEEVWSLRKIEKIEAVNYCGMYEGVFQNCSIKFLRSNQEVCQITLADLPLMNANDLITILKLLDGMEKRDVTSLKAHFRVMLKGYYLALSKFDYVLAKEIKREVQRPFVHRDGISKCKEGRILQEPLWGVIFKTVRNKKTANGFFGMDEREKFPNENVAGIIKRVVLCEENSEKEIQEVNKILAWMLAARKILVNAKSLIF